MSLLTICKLDERAVTPKYATEGSAGMDLAAVLDEPLTLAPGERAAIRTGIAMALPTGHEGQLRPRSGLAKKHGISMVNAPGTIDEDYRAEVHVLLINLGHEPYTFHHGDRIAQLIVAPIVRVGIMTVPSIELLGETGRGAGGFGSSGR